MSKLSIVLSSEMADSLATALLHFVWQGAVLSSILFCTVRLMGIRSAPTRHLLSVVTLLSMGMAPVLTFVWSCYEVTPIRPGDLSGRPPMVLVQTGDATDVDWRHASAFWLRPDFQIAVLTIWLTGVVILGTRLAFGFAMTLWIRANVTPLVGQLEQLVQTLGQRIGVNAVNRVYTSMRVGQAMAVGFIRPIVLIPAAWITALSPQMLEAVIAHELAHIRRWDLWVNMLQRIVEVLLFYHPAVWWLSRRISLEREMCCDEIAADCLDRAEYARSLESVARISRGNQLLATSIHGETQMNLLNRIRYLLGAAPADAAGNWWAAGFMAMIFPLLAVAAVSITEGTAPNTAIAEEGKPVETPDTNLAIGDPVCVKMTGDVAKEYFRLNLPERKFNPGYDATVIGNVTEIFPDGRFKIERTIPVERQEPKSQQFSMTFIAQPSQIKLFPKPANDNDVGIIANIDGKSVHAKLVGEGPQRQLVIKDNDSKSEKPAPDKSIPVHVSASVKIDRRYAEISDLMNVTFKLWELKEQVGK